LLHGQTYTYATLNGCAAGCVLFSLTESFNLSAAVIQICWITLSVVGIVRLSVLHHRSARIRFAEEEQRFLDAKLPTLSKPLARHLLDGGYWVDGAPGAVLAREGEPVGDLVYLARGAAAVSLDGQVIGYCRDSTFVGELTCMTGAPATATVTIAEPSRYFCIGAAALRHLAPRHPELHRALHDAFADDTRKKLIMAGPYLQAQRGRSRSIRAELQAAAAGSSSDPTRFIHEPHDVACA